MNKDIFTYISNNNNSFFTDNFESLHDWLFPGDSIQLIEEEEENILNESILPLLENIDKMQRENQQNKTNDISIPCKEIFFIKNGNNTNNKRGKPLKNKSSKKEIHDNTTFDNLITKIQVHFLTFVIDFCNAALKEEYKYSKDCFKYINNKKKINVKFSYLLSLKKSSIKDLLKMDISTKYKKYENSHNKDLLEKIENSSSNLSELFEMNYLELFSYYYNERKPLKEIVYKNKVINLSKNVKCKSFSYLLEKNKNLRKNLIDTAEREYIKSKSDK